MQTFERMEARTKYYMDVLLNHAKLLRDLKDAFANKLAERRINNVLKYRDN